MDVKAVGGWSEMRGGLPSLSKEEGVCSCYGNIQLSLCWKRKQGEDHALYIMLCTY